MEIRMCNDCKYYYNCAKQFEWQNSEDVRGLLQGDFIRGEIRLANSCVCRETTNYIRFND